MQDDLPQIGQRVTIRAGIFAGEGGVCISRSHLVGDRFTVADIEMDSGHRAVVTTRGCWTPAKPRMRGSQEGREKGGRISAAQQIRDEHGQFAGKRGVKRG